MLEIKISTRNFKFPSSLLFFNKILQVSAVIRNIISHFFEWIDFQKKKGPWKKKVDGERGWQNLNFDFLFCNESSMLVFNTENGQCW